MQIATARPCSAPPVTANLLGSIRKRLHSKHDCEQISRTCRRLIDQQAPTCASRSRPSSSFPVSLSGPATPCSRHQRLTFSAATYQRTCPYRASSASGCPSYDTACGYGSLDISPAQTPPPLRTSDLASPVSSHSPAPESISAASCCGSEQRTSGLSAVAEIIFQAKNLQISSQESSFFKGEISRFIFKGRSLYSISI